MPFVFSWKWQRNPRRLLDACGRQSVGSSAEERRFMQALEAMPDTKLGDVLVIMGGFMDGFLGRAYCLREELPLSMRDFDVFYREHDEDASVRRIVQRYGKASRRIVLVGHSWGASSLVRDVLVHPECCDIPIEALVTLDPVGVRGPRFLPAVKHWLNVYIPYDEAQWSRENNVARIGLPWEHVRQASCNYRAAVLRHPDARGMFRQCASAFLDAAVSGKGSV